MKDYLKIAAINLDDAYNSKKKWKMDDIFVDICCQRLADSVECCLRYVMSVAGLTEKRGHKLYEMTCYAESYLSAYDWFSRLLDVTRYMGDWHTRVMYVKDFKGDTAKAEEVFEILKLMLKDLKSFNPSTIKNISSEDRIQAILDRNRTGLILDDVREYIPKAYLIDTDVNISLLNDVVMLAVKAVKNK